MKYATEVSDHGVSCMSPDVRRIGRTQMPFATSPWCLHENRVCLLDKIVSEEPVTRYGTARVCSEWGVSW